MSIGYWKARDRSTGVNVDLKTGKHTDYNIIGEYKQFDTALVVQVFRSEQDMGIRLQTGNVDSEIGSILCKPINGNSAASVKAYPLNSNINQYPAEGEYVKVGSFGSDSERIYYELISTSGKVNFNGNIGLLQAERNRRINTPLQEGETFVDITSKFKVGSQFKLRPLTSDLIFQSRFGSNIRMTDLTPSSETETSPTLILSNNISPAYDGIMEETLNGQGSYIILASGPGYSGLNPPMYADFIKSNDQRVTPSAFEMKKTYRENHIVNREAGNWFQEDFIFNSQSPASEFVGDRIILSSNQIIQESTSGDSIYLSNGNIVMYSNRSTSVDAMEGMDINTNKASFRLKANNTYINSPNIFLGQEEDRTQPAVLGENLLTFIELLIGSLKQYLDLTAIFEEANYTPGQSEATNNLRHTFQELLVTGRIPDDLRRNLLSDKVFVSPNRIDPQIDSPPARIVEGDS